MMGYFRLGYLMNARLEPPEEAKKGENFLFLIDMMYKNIYFPGSFCVCQPLQYNGTCFIITEVHGGHGNTKALTFY